MIIQNIKAQQVDGKLGLTWEVFNECKAITVQLATDIHFTTSIRSYVVPPSSSCVVDCGSSVWYIRIGAWTGSVTDGSIMWSGIVGPIIILSPPVASPAKPIISVTTIQRIVNGLRIYINQLSSFYMILEYSKNSSFLANETTTIYSLEVRQGFIDCMTLPSSHIPVQFNGLRDLTKSAVPPPVNDFTYYIRISTFATEPDTLPTSLKPLTEGIVVHGKPKAAIRPHTTADHTTCVADKVLLRESKDKKALNFTSYSDYLQHLSAKARHF